MKKKILIIEDEETLLSVLSKKLEKEGFQVVKAKNGEEGLSVFVKEQPDLILLDIIMPVMDGMEMLKRLRETEKGKDVPVVILTNLSEAGKTAEALEQGVFDYLVKSDWKLADLVEKIKQRIKS